MLDGGLLLLWIGGEDGGDSAHRTLNAKYGSFSSYSSCRSHTFGYLLQCTNDLDCLVRIRSRPRHSCFRRPYCPRQCAFERQAPHHRPVFRIHGGCRRSDRNGALPKFAGCDVLRIGQKCARRRMDRGSWSLVHRCFRHDGDEWGLLLMQFEPQLASFRPVFSSCPHLLPPLTHYTISLRHRTFSQATFPLVIHARGLSPPSLAKQRTARSRFIDL